MATQQNIKTIKISNPPIEDNIRTYLSKDTSSGTATLYIVNKGGFSTTNGTKYYALIGEYGSQHAEIVLVTADNSTTALGSASCKYAHSASDPITKIDYNQIRVYGGSVSGFTPAINSPITTIDIDPTEIYTEYVYNGTAYSYFRTAYYNGNDSEVSAYSDEIAVANYTRKSVKKIIESGLKKALTSIDSSQNSVLNWDIALDIVQDGIEEILTRKRVWPFLRTIKSDTTTTKDVKYIDKPSDLSMLEFLIVNNKQLLPMDRVTYNDYAYSNAATATGEPVYFVEKNDKYYLLPTPNSAYDIVYEYYKVPATITTDLSTEIDFQFASILKYYCAAHFAWLRGNDKRGDKMYNIFEKILNDQIDEYTGPEQTGEAESLVATSIYSID